MKKTLHTEVWSMTRIPLVALLAALAVSACGSAADRDAVAADSTAADSIPAGQLPRFTGTGELLRPDGWEAWVLAGTSMGLGYTEPTTLPEPGAAPGIFLNVYIQPWAYERFMETGEFPQGTMFILSGSDAVDRVDPARRGFTMGGISLMEVHLKQEGLHESGWGFYGFGGDAASAAMIPGEVNCYSCHRDEAAHDQAFVQFYPKIRERLGLVTAADSSGGMH
jgi:hypothetical protein